MSRAISTEMLNAIEKISGIRAGARVTLFKNRNYFDEFDETSGSAVDAPTSGSIVENPIPQDICYDENNDCLYNIYTDPITEYITIGTSGSFSTSGSSLNILPRTSSGSEVTSGSPIESPAWHKFGVYFPFIYHLDNDGNIRVDELDPATLAGITSSGSAVCASSGSVIEESTTTPYCGIAAVAEHEYVKLFLDDGGFGVSYCDFTTGLLVTKTYPHRFMVPDEVFEENAENAYMLNYFHAVKRSDGIWVYFSYTNGEVKGIHLNIYDEWSDTFTAIPQDLSVFKIGNAFVDSNERIHLCGQFQRVDEFDAFSSSSIWNLLCWSDDGKTFTLDRNTLFSLMGQRFVVLQEGTNIHFASLNRYAHDTATYSSIYENTDSLLLRGELKSIGGSPGNGYDVEFVTVNDALIDHELVADGNIAKLEFGVNTTGSALDFITWDTCIVSSTSIELKDGARNLALRILTESLYRLQLFSYPFYLEIQGKQSIYDPLEDMSNMYKAPNASNLTEPFNTDFWNNEDLFSSGGLYYLFHNASGEETVMSGDLKEYLYLSDYPEVTELPLTFKIYGWGRIGIPSAAPEVTYDSTPSSNPNDDFEAILKVQKEDGSEETITITSGSAITETHFKQYWKEGSSRLSSGVLPIMYSVEDGSGVEIGDKIIEVGIKASSSSPTVFYPERIEIPEVMMCIDPSALPQDSYGVEEAMSYDSVYKDNVTFPFDTLWDGFVPSKYMVYGNTAYNDGDNAYALTGSAARFYAGGYYHGGSMTRAFGDLYDIPGARATFRWGTNWGDIFYTGHQVVYFSYVYSDGTHATHQWIADQFDGWVAHTVNWRDLSVDMPGTRKKIVSLVIEVGGFTVGGSGVGSKYIDNLVLTGFSGVIDESLFIDDDNKTGLEIKNVGLPNVYFSSKPYSAFNFEASVKVKIEGEYACAGVIGIAEDGQNYICAQATEDTIDIVKVRNGARTVLATTSYDTDDTYKRIMFIHKDGDLYVRMQEDLSWGEPLLTYRWKYSDGPMATDDDLFHVGIYSIIDAPKFRICSFDSGQSSVLGLLPGYDTSALDDFPSSGTVEIDNIVYDYGSKITSALDPRGPFQVRCCNSWNYSHPDDGESYSGVSIEIANFEWQSNPSNHNKYHGMILASNAGYNYIINETDFKVWITTRGDLVYITNRSRIFCDGLNEEAPVSCMDKAYITIGLAYLSIQADQTRVFHQEGAYCYIHSDSKIEFTDFYASSAEHDTTVKDMIARVGRMAGAKTLFPGDKVIDSLFLEDGTQERL